MLPWKPCAPLLRRSFGVPVGQGYATPSCRCGISIATECKKALVCQAWNVHQRISLWAQCCRFGPSCIPTGVEGKNVRVYRALGVLKGTSKRKNLISFDWWSIEEPCVHWFRSNRLWEFQGDIAACLFFFHFFRLTKRLLMVRVPFLVLWKGNFMAEWITQLMSFFSLVPQELHVVKINPESLTTACLIIWLWFWCLKPQK